MREWQNLAYDLRTIALLNPRLALMLVRGQPIAPRAYNIRLQWDQVTAGQRISGSLDERMYQDCWVQQLTYTVRRADANLGAFDRAENDEYTKRNPYVDVDIRIEGTERYQLTEGLTPLENIATTSDAERNYMNRGWTIGTDQNIFIDGVLQRTLAEDEVPYVVAITLSVLELSGCRLHTIAYADAVCALQHMGLYPKEAPPE